MKSHRCAGKNRVEGFRKVRGRLESEAVISSEWHSLSGFHVRRTSGETVGNNVVSGAKLLNSQEAGLSPDPPETA